MTSLLLKVKILGDEGVGKQSLLRCVTNKRG